MQHFDAAGAVLVTAGLASLVYAITQAGQEGWLAPETLGFGAAALVLLAGFVALGAAPGRAADALRHPADQHGQPGPTSPGFILGTALFSMFLMLTLYMQQVLGYTAMKTGVAYLAVAGTAILWSAVAAQLVTRIGVKPVLVVGMVSLTAGLAVLHAGLGRRLVPR